MPLIRPFALVLFLGIALPTDVGLAQGVCPQDLCACLGAAADMTTVSEKLTMRGYKYKDFGAIEAQAPRINGSACSGSGSFTGIPGAVASIAGDLLLGAGSGSTAARFFGPLTHGVSQPGLFVSGDLSSGGGTLKGSAHLNVAGATDVTGLSSQVASCLEAIPAIVSASAFLAALPSTQPSLGSLVLRSGQDPVYEIVAGPGVVVLDATTIQLRSRKTANGPESVFLLISLDPATEVVIINVEKSLWIGDCSGVDVVGGTARDVIFNVFGKGAQVRVGRCGSVTPPILAPAATVRTARGATVSNLFARTLRLRGGDVDDELHCSPGSP